MTLENPEIDMEPENLKEIKTSDGEELRSHYLKMYSIGEGEPVTTMVAGLHGDEKPASLVAEQVFLELEDEDIKGTVNVIPRANILAFEADRRETPAKVYDVHESDERDMNRCFDAAREALEGKRGHLNQTESLAREILEVVEMSDYLIDMHNATGPDRKIPHIRYKKGGDIRPGLSDEMYEMCRASGLNTVIGTREADIGEGVLGYASPAVGAPAVTIEVGGAEDFTEEDKEIYRSAVRNLLSYAGNIDDDYEKIPHRALDVYDSLMTTYSEHAGRLEFDVELGDKVERGDRIATVESPEREKGLSVVAMYDGVLESRNTKDKVGDNERVCKIAYRKG